MKSFSINSPREFEFGQPDFTSKALQALTEREGICIKVSSERAELVEKAVIAYDEYLAARQSGHRGLLQLARFGRLGFRTVSLWPVLNRAALLNRVVTVERRGTGLVIYLGRS